MSILPRSRPVGANPPELLAHRRFLRATRNRRTTSWKWSSMLGLLPLLMTLALIPPLLLIWFHLADLRFLEIMPLSFGGAASLGAVLLLGLVMLAYMALCLILPSLFIALAVAQYGTGKVPRPVVAAWAVSCGALAIAWFISADNPNFVSAFMFWPAHLATAALVGTWILCAAYPRSNGKPEQPTGTAVAFLKTPLIAGIGNGLYALLAFSALIFTIDYLAQDFFLVRPLPAWAKAAFPLLIASVISLGPGMFYMWRNRKGAPGMNKLELAVLMLMAAFAMLTISYSAPREVRHLTLVASGIVGNPVRPQLHRLPDGWNKQDEQVLAEAFQSKHCTRRPQQRLKDATFTRWICGYQNFSFGRARLICNRPYVDTNLKFADGELTCVLYVDNTLASLVILPPPGAARPSKASPESAFDNAL